MTEQYDNTNKGAGWPVKAVSGSADVGGSKFYMSIVSTGVREAKKPSHNIFLTGQGPDRLLYPSVLFPCDNPEHGLASGQIKVAGFDYWVNMYVNKSDHERAPLVDVRFKPKEQQAAPQGLPPTPADDEIPF